MTADIENGKALLNGASLSTSGGNIREVHKDTLRIIQACRETGGEEGWTGLIEYLKPSCDQAVRSAALSALQTFGLPNVPSTGYLEGGHATFLFRDEKLWMPLAKEILDRFPTGCDINAYACSDGHDPLSMRLALAQLSRATDIGRYPITAIDKTQKCIDRGKSGHLIMSADYLYRVIECGVEAAKILENVSRSGSLYPFAEHRIASAETDSFFEWEKPLLYSLSENARRNITFRQGDFLDLASGRQPMACPGVVMFRNAWYLLHNSMHLDDVARNLYEKLPTGSLLVVGRSEILGVPTPAGEDPEYGVVNLAAAGFRRVVDGLQYVYEKA